MRSPDVSLHSSIQSFLLQTLRSIDLRVEGTAPICIPFSIHRILGLDSTGNGTLPKALMTLWFS
ncbi:hypothetical protein CK203_021867 [Vitis vinifera]|uniref:Uncharacterized protein n=1 Tax=Vitis vinifera TaxID=29760 RepID=A0A438JFP9_VITVI|nr:hypothetical protein CK203_115232 [Vitis vinifera]RVX07781.1 hypothetical protein CK203_021867 [Vitis vinifera]